MAARSKPLVARRRIPAAGGLADGTTLTTTAAGELALHGVTREVEVPVEAQLVDDTIAVTGSLDVALADYDIEAPTGLRVLSVADSGVVEFRLFFTPA